MGEFHHETSPGKNEDIIKKWIQIELLENAKLLPKIQVKVNSLHKFPSIIQKPMPKFGKSHHIYLGIHFDTADVWNWLGSQPSLSIKHPFLL